MSDTAYTNTNIKYTSDGKKVIVVGKLNAQETIVQEIFIQNNVEVPSGINFVVSSLHDAPSISWKEQRLIDLGDSYIKQAAAWKQKIDNLNNINKEVVNKLEKLLSYRTKFLKDFDESIFNTYINFMLGKIKYLVKYNEILEFDKTLTESSCCNGNPQLRLISLLGNPDRNTSWNLHDYSDGSGSCSTVYPCETLEEAKEYLTAKINKRNIFSESDYAAMKKYDLKLDENKLSVFLSKHIEDSKKRIDSIYEEKKTLILKNQEFIIECEELLSKITKKDAKQS